MLLVVRAPRRASFRASRHQQDRLRGGWRKKVRNKKWLFGLSGVEVRFMSRNLEVCHHFFATNTLAKSGGIFRSPVPLSYHLIRWHYCNREQYVHLHLGLWRPIPRQRPLKVWLLRHICARIDMVRTYPTVRYRIISFRRGCNWSQVFQLRVHVARNAWYVSSWLN